jgi:hypothetical protein
MPRPFSSVTVAAIASVLAMAAFVLWAGCVDRGQPTAQPPASLGLIDL